MRSSMIALSSMRTFGLVVLAATLATLGFSPSRAQDGAVEPPDNLPRQAMPVATCAKDGDLMLVGNRIGRDKPVFLHRKITGDTVADCDPGLRSNDVIFDVPKDYSALGNGTACYRSGDTMVLTERIQIGHQIWLRKASDDVVRDCGPVVRADDVVLLRGDGERWYTFKDLWAGHLFYTSEDTENRIGLGVYNIAQEKMVVATDEGRAVRFTDTEFAYWDYVRSAERQDCPKRYDHNADDMGATSVYKMKIFRLKTGETRKGQFGCLRSVLNL